METRLRNFELVKDLTQLRFMTEYSVSRCNEIRRLTRIFFRLLNPLRSLPVAGSEKSRKRDVYMIGDRPVYLIKEAFRIQPTEGTDEAIDLRLALANGIAFGADPRLYIHTLDGSIYISRRPVPLQDRAAGRDSPKHIDLMTGKPPLAFCSGEIYVAFAGKNKRRFAITFTNKSGLFLPDGESLERTIKDAMSICEPELTIGIDYERRRILLYHKNKTITNYQ